MQTINLVTLTGPVGQPPACRDAGAGEPAVRFTLSTRRQRRPADPPSPELDWHTVVAYDALGQELMERVGRGDTVTVVGELRHDRWQDRDGSPRVRTYVLAREVALVQPRRLPLAAYPHREAEAIPA